MAVARTGIISMDCAEPLALAEFWAAMLGGETVVLNDRTVLVRSGWVWLSALKVDGYAPPTWPDDDVPKQLHLDLAVDDLAAAVAKAEALGARVATEQPAEDRWCVMLDPAGHPFCLTIQIPTDLRTTRTLDPS
jgi:Glyoxalase-like domain